jgi:hypothetical protein
VRNSWITLGALCAGVVALALFAWLKTPKSQDIPLTVSATKPDAARSMRVMRKGAVLAALEKRGETWFLTEPAAAPADSLQVLRLLAVLEAKSRAPYPATEAAKFGLDAPQADLIIDGQRFAFGAVNNVTREQYVMTGSGIFLLELRFGAALPDNAVALLRKTVLAATEVPARFDLGASAVAYDGKKWNTLSSAAAAATDAISQDDYNRWVTQWREGSALRAEFADTRKPAAEWSITLKSGAKITLGVVQTAPELIVRRADLGVQFVFVGDIGKQMMAPPSARTTAHAATQK